MSDFEILCWIQSFACGFRHGINHGEFFIDWLDREGRIHSTKGINIKDAVLGAMLEREKMHTCVPVENSHD